MKLAFLYAGQGSQKTGMGKDFYETYDEYREFIHSIPGGAQFRYLMEEAPMEELTLTQNTQPCMAIFAAGVTRILQKNNIIPDAVCGLSLGEYGALHAAGVIDASTYIELTAYRGKVMAEAAENHLCSMSAVLGVSREKVESACLSASSVGFVEVVNENCPGQTVICGEECAVSQAEQNVLDLGAKRCIRLQVGGPFHTKYMKPAAEKLKTKLEEIYFSDAFIPVVLNVNAEYLENAESLREILPRQMQSRVKLEESLRRLIADGVDTFIEIGPGNAVSGFAKKTAKSMNKEITVYAISKVSDLDAIWHLAKKK